MKRQGKRTDLVSVLEEDTTSILLEQKLKEHTAATLSNTEKISRSKFLRYCRLSNLIDELLALVDDKKLNINAAADYISYMSVTNQKELYKLIASNELRVSINNAKRLKEMGEAKELKKDDILAVFKSEQRKQTPIKIEFSLQELNDLLGAETTVDDAKQLILEMIRTEIGKRNGYKS